MNVSASLIVSATLIVFGGIFTRWQKAAPDLDQQVLDQLKKQARIYQSLMTSSSSCTSPMKNPPTLHQGK